MPLGIRVVDRIIDQGDYEALATLAAGDVLRYSGTKWRNFAGTGATLPTAAVVGQLFLHTPTGRRNLMFYDGTAWIPVLSLGTWTVYVDPVNGTDNENLGYGTGANAFRTIQYAVNQIADKYAENITILPAAGTYNETVVVRGKQPTRNYTITIRGELSVVSSITATGGVQGSGATFGSVEFGSWGAWENRWLQGKSGSNNNVYRLIDSISGTTATVVGYWSAAPVSGDSFDVVEPGTTVNQINVLDGQLSVVIENIAFNYTDGTSSFPTIAGINAAVTWRRCRQSFATGSNVQTGVNAALTLEESYFERCRFFVANDATLTARGCKFHRPHTTGSGGRLLHVFLGSKCVLVTRPSVIDGASNGCTGLLAASGANCEVNSLYCRVRSCAGGGTGRGLRAESTGTITGTTNIQYSGNDTNTSVDAATYGVVA